VFYGFGAFTRHNLVWAFVGDDWGFELGAWAMIGAVLLLFLGWLLYNFYSNTNKMGFRLTPLARVDLVNGIAPDEDEIERPKNWLKMVGSWILNNM
jgi:hypothetical protein